MDSRKIAFSAQMPAVFCARCRYEAFFTQPGPFANAKVIAEAVETYETVTSISPVQRNAIDRANALALFPQFA